MTIGLQKNFGEQEKAVVNQVEKDHGSLVVIILLSEMCTLEKIKKNPAITFVSILPLTLS